MHPAAPSARQHLCADDSGAHRRGFAFRGGEGRRVVKFAARPSGEERKIVPLHRDRAVVLRTYRYAESDRIVVLLTENRGKVRALARGVRKAKSRLGGRIEAMSHVDLELYQGRGELETVRTAATVNGFASLRTDLDRLTKGLALCEVVDQLAQDNNVDEKLYAMTVGALTELATNDSPLLLPAFELKLMASQGYAPQLDECVSCGGTDELIAFDVATGGVLCRSCRTGRAISPEGIALMRQVVGGQLRAALAAPVSPATTEVSEIVRALVEHHLDRRLRVERTVHG
jgi:DNA repair protein RecO (recombination protein O)